MNNADAHKSELRPFEHMSWEEKWNHLKKLVRSGIKSNEESAQMQHGITTYMEGKLNSYRFVLNWMTDMENNQYLGTEAEQRIQRRKL